MISFPSYLNVLWVRGRNFTSLNASECHCTCLLPFLGLQLKSLLTDGHWTLSTLAAAMPADDFIAWLHMSVPSLSSSSVNRRLFHTFPIQWCRNNRGSLGINRISCLSPFQEHSEWQEYSIVKICFGLANVRCHSAYFLEMGDTSTHTCPKTLVTAPGIATRAKIDAQTAWISWG